MTRTPLPVASNELPNGFNDSNTLEAVTLKTMRGPIQGTGDLDLVKRIGEFDVHYLARQTPSGIRECITVKRGDDAVYAFICEGGKCGEDASRNGVAVLDFANELKRYNA